MANQTDLEKLFEKIACCENVCNYFNGGLEESQCCKIIRSQFSLYDYCTYTNFQNDCSNFKNNFQIPEPWSGHIDKAPLLFLGSNPSIDAYEKYPRFGESCCSKQFNGKPLIDFYNNRFENNPEKNGWSDYWKQVRSVASWLYCKNTIKPGCDYALSEVVHCKSKKQEGAEEALTECRKKYLECLLDISPAKVVVVFGASIWNAVAVYLLKENAKNIKNAKKAFKYLEKNGNNIKNINCKHPDENKNCKCVLKIYKQININNNNGCKYFIFANHPSYCNGHGHAMPRGFVDCLEPGCKKLFQKKINKYLKSQSKKPDCNSKQVSK